MSSPTGNVEPPVPPADVDDPMRGSEQEDEGEGDATMDDGIPDDSSEEPEEDAEEERRIREGFIVDEDEEEEDDDEERRRKHKRRKKHHRRRKERDEEEDLEEDDLELLEENTGAPRSKGRLTRLRRGRDSASPAAAESRHKRKAVAESSEDDLDDDLELPQVQDIQRIWDDDRGGKGDDEDEGEFSDDFIEYDEEEEAAGAMDEQEREQKRQERRRERRKALIGSREMVGIDENAWDEIHEVFGDGHEYDWALADDDEARFDEELGKPDMKYQDVFEPSEIRARLLTEDDDLIRAQDTPERMQLASSSLSQSSTLSIYRALGENDLDDAATWVLTRLSPQKERDFFRGDGRYFHHLADLVAAITWALRFLFVQEYEVPYIWTHKRDFITYFNPKDMRTQIDLLSLDDLWRVHALGQKYRSLLDRRSNMEVSYARLAITDEYYENEIRRKADTVEVIADATEWLTLKYKSKKKDTVDFSLDDDEVDPQKRKLPSRISAYEVAKKSVVSKLAEAFGIKMEHVVLNFLADNRSHFVDDPELNPEAYAEQFTDAEAGHQEAQQVLARARMIIATELGKDPLLRQEMRTAFKTNAHISVLPTDRGVNKIDEHHTYFNFKYLYQKPALEMLESPQFLHILNAERDLLVTVSISLASDAKEAFEQRLINAFMSDGFSDTARAWNEERARVVREAVDQHLLVNGAKWIREWLREEVEDFLARRCSSVLRKRIDVQPYATADMQPGDTPSVLAMSWGKGDYQRDDITVVFLDHEGRLREHTRIDNLMDQEHRDEMHDILQRRRPEVIVVGGFSMTTVKLMQRVKEFVRGTATGESQPGVDGGWGDKPQEHQNAYAIPVIYAPDEVARIYQHSKRAEEEFGALSPLAKYCVGLARYTQSPLNEFAALGPDIAAISFDEDSQPLLPREKLLSALERTLVDVTNSVGVDINRAVIDTYYQHLLPFVCGLGPRKAQALARKVASIGGNLVNRDQFIKNGLLTTKIFLNAAAFLRIVTDADNKPSKSRRIDETDIADPLDSTRIHPEDYELARKMATDALELDEEDVQDEHPSHVVSMIMQEDDNVKKLDELNLDDFAVNMYEANEDRKRHTLNLIRDELLKPFGDRREAFRLPEDWDVLTMLSGESKRTLRVGFIVSVSVIRTGRNFVNVRLDSGVEGVINQQYVSDQGVNPEDYVKKGQTIQGVIIHLDFSLSQDKFLVELSCRPADVATGDVTYRVVKHDDAWNRHQHERDREIQARKKRAEVGQARRVIKHPNFHNLKSAQAEAYLSTQQRGDVVIRPSSKGVDHLAVTWKVDSGLYQHLDVVEPNADPTGQTLGTRFIVDGRHEFADLDELIVNHIQAIARRVEDLMAHEKYKNGEDELQLHLRNYVKANPSKSTYGFTLNRKRPGHFHLCFLANASASIQTWPVRVAPEAYYLFETPAVGVAELCDAFKVRHLHESQNLGGGVGKTPYGGRTPARTPGHATPGRMSVRQVGRTPNPYAATPAAAPTPGWGATPAAAPTPAWGAPPPARPMAPPSAYGAPPPQTPLGYQTPSYPGATPVHVPPPAHVPTGMNPARAAMIREQGGWGA